MSLVRGCARRRIVHGVVEVLLAVCVLVLLGSVLLPHGPACDGTVRADCAACTIDAAASVARTGPSTSGADLTRSDTLVPLPFETLSSVFTDASADGRAPPA